MINYARHLILLLSIATIVLPSSSLATMEEEKSQEMARFGMESLHIISDVKTRSLSAENPTGEKGKGAMAVPNPNRQGPQPAGAGCADDLGQGWKVRPFVRVNKGETVTLMDNDGPGIIQHIWLVDGVLGENSLSRSHVLRFYWDRETTPSIEVPVADFFAVGHQTFAPVVSMPVTVHPANSLNCYWQMPFRKHAKITFSNESETDDLPLLAYQITYAETEVSDDAGYLHVQFRRARTGNHNPYVIVDDIRGKGKYVGTFISWSQRDEGWNGITEGEIKFYIDGDKEFPTICGTGTEDYFCHSFGLYADTSSLYTGNKRVSKPGEFPVLWSLYRWHIIDPIYFEKDLKITLQAMGWNKQTGKYRLLDDDIASVAYWYQTEPHAEFSKFPSVEERCKKVKPVAYLMKKIVRVEDAFECESLEILTKSPGTEAVIQDVSGIAIGVNGDKQLWVKPKKKGDYIELSIPSESTGAQSITLYTVKSHDYGILEFSVNGVDIPGTYDSYGTIAQRSDPIKLGEFVPIEGRFVLKVRIAGNNSLARLSGDYYYFGLDCIVLSVD
ncbi:hypothetical protein SMSP2_00767 [Limihaloglobus sulfuriphilus]|uniref:DUF2961 domain-containing protein n=1 Tax=Limihaloglobus sulfuriphilus TaxID=1851148 RepID=A0A1Q2MCP1_9BACT|nr:glycoside hydrolase family 172 protein [Limihaloglobus sulfuriphilus]AQQ70419.1 hypothetical protein SMSP2_00767 [Limihaloglobus sulfuriphilus]